MSTVVNIILQNLIGIVKHRFVCFFLKNSVAAVQKRTAVRLQLDRVCINFSCNLKRCYFL